MEIRLLGPVEAWDDGLPVDVGHARMRCVLAVLAEEPGRAVPVVELIDRVWSGAPPDAARRTLQTYVSRLRAVQGIEVRYRAGAYVMDVDESRVDVCRYRCLVVAARASVDAGDDRTAVDRFDEALGLWRGTVVADLDGHWALALRHRLAEDRLVVLEDKLDAKLRLGRHADVVSELTDLVRAHPRRERLVGQLMLALYRGGRQSDALEIYRRTKQHLLADGLDPSASLQRLEQDILNAVPTLAGEPEPAAGGVDRLLLGELASEVARQWVHERLVPSLHEIAYATLKIAEQPDAVWNSYGTEPATPLGARRPLPPGTRLTDLFGHRFNRRCLVLGAAGAGKTTLLLELTRDLLDADGQIPVVLLLSRWSPHPAGLAGWILDEMAEHYKQSADDVRSWLRSGRLTLVLDGLDEVPAVDQAACAQEINAFRASEYGALTGLVVSSRTADYVETGVRLDLGGAVVVQPLTGRQVDHVLGQAGPQFSELRTAVGTDQVLADLLTSPLMLSVAVQANATTPQLSWGSTEDRRRRIYDLYLARMLSRDRGLRNTTVPNSAKATHRGLIWLARLMRARSETIFYPDWFTPAWLPPQPQRMATGLTHGLAAGVVVGVIYVLHALLANGVPSEVALDVSPAYGIPVGATVCLAVTVFCGRAWPRPVTLACCGAVFVLAGGFHHAVLGWQRDGLAAGLTMGVRDGLIYGCTSGMAVLLALVLGRWLVKVDGDLGWSWRRIEQGAGAGAVIGVAVALPHGVAFGLTHGAVTHLFLGVGEGLIMGLGIGLAIGMAFAMADIVTARPAAHWRWSWRRLGAALLTAAGYGLIYGLLFVLLLQGAMGPAMGPVYGLLVGVVFWLTFALGHGLIPDRDLPPPAPARAVSASLRAAAPPTITVAALVALMVMLDTKLNPAHQFRLTLMPLTLLAGLLTLWFTGGGVWLAHHTARWVAWRAGLLPRDLLAFLAHAEERTLLRRGGGGYQFVHRTFQDHVADRDPG